MHTYILPDGQLEDKTVLVKTMVKNISTKFVKDVITESLNKVAPSQAVCTTIELCTVIIGKTWSICGRAKESCRYHNKAKTQKVTPLIDDIESQFYVTFYFLQKNELLPNYNNKFIFIFIYSIYGLIYILIFLF